MRILTVHQPWAYLLAAGIKTIENRSRKTDYRGALLILSACKRRAKETDESIEERYDVQIPPHLPRCGIVGLVTLVDCITASSNKWFSGPWGWVVTDAHPLPLIEYRGSLTLQFAPPSLMRRVNRLL